MSIQLKTDELLEIILELGPPEVITFRVQLESLTQAMADRVAHHFGVTAGQATFQGVDFAGTCCPMHPAFEGQPMPEIFGHYDQAEERGE